MLAFEVGIFSTASDNPFGEAGDSDNTLGETGDRGASPLDPAGVVNGVFRSRIVTCGVSFVVKSTFPSLFSSLLVFIVEGYIKPELI